MMIMTSFKYFSVIHLKIQQLLLSQAIVHPCLSRCNPLQKQAGIVQKFLNVISSIVSTHPLQWPILSYSFISNNSTLLIDYKTPIYLLNDTLYIVLSFENHLHRCKHQVQIDLHGTGYISRSALAYTKASHMFAIVVIVTYTYCIDCSHCIVARSMRNILILRNYKRLP